MGEHHITLRLSGWRGHHVETGCCWSTQWASKKRWQEYTEELYKKDLRDLDNCNDNHSNHDGLITHLEPDILEFEVKWALGSIIKKKASGGDGIPVEIFQILKDDAVKSGPLNMPSNLEESAVATGLEKVSFKAMPKNVQTTTHNCTHFTG